MDEQEVLNKIVGANSHMAFEYLKQQGYIIRLSREDDKNYAVTDDVKANRVNLEIDNNLITKAYIG